jgi:ABC-type amino acid transport substrate-binding protein
MKICVVDSTTYASLVPQIIPQARIVISPDNAAYYRNLQDNICNVLAGDQFETSAATVKNNGYLGSYEQGNSFFSKEPLALVTRDDDPTWADFVSWIVEGLLHAEEKNITQSNPSLFFTSDLFGIQYNKMFVNAIAAVGNYAEIYKRNLQSVVPRKPVNTINDGTSGLIYSMPFGDLEQDGPAPLPGSTLQTITYRGYLRCGITRRAIFAVFDTATETYSGFDVDFCRALSAAIFGGVTNTIEFRDLVATERFVALQRGDVDVLSRITTHNFERDVYEPTAKVGFTFSQPDFYDGIGFGGIPP